MRKIYSGAAAGLLLMAGAARAQSRPGEVVTMLLHAVHGGDATAFEALRAPSATIEVRNKAKSKPKRLEASDLNSYLKDCTLADPGDGEGSEWTLSWKCKEAYSRMEFKLSSGRVQSITVSEGPPWLTNLRVDHIRFPNVVSAN